MQCPFCGNLNKEEARFCTACGAQLAVPMYDPNRYPAQPPKQKSYTWIYVLVIILLVVLIGAGTFLLFRFRNEDHTEGGVQTTLPIPTAAPAGGLPQSGGSSDGNSGSKAEKNPTVPNVVGMRSADAYSKLGESDFNYKAEFDYSDSVPADYVIAQSPKEGEQAQSRSTVTLTISKGTKPVETPKNDTPKTNDTPAPAQTYTDTTDRYGLNASSRYLSQSDISWMNLEEVQFAINEIYAKNGFRFTKAGDTKTYFESMDWYNPDTTNMNTIVSRMNKYEYANVKLMGQYRDSLK